MVLGSLDPNRCPRSRLVSVMFGSDQIWTYRGGDERSSLADSYRLSSPERVPEDMKLRTEEMQDGRSQTGDSERSKEPQRDMKEKQVILVLR